MAPKVAQFYAAPYFLVHKKVSPPPHLYQHPPPPSPPLINDRSLILRIYDHFLFEPLRNSTLHHLHFVCAI